jgi:HK97 family phage major capsid protein
MGADDNKPTLTHSQSINRLKEIDTELQRLGELDTLSADDETYFRSLTDEFTTTDEHRKRLERTADLAKVRSVSNSLSATNLRTERGSAGSSQAGSNEYDRDPILNPDSVEDHRFRNPWDLSEVRTFGRDKDEVNAELRARAFDAIEKMSGATDHIRETGTKILDKYDDGDASIARMVLGTSKPAYLRAWSKMAANRGHLLKPEEQQALDEVRAMSLTPSGGGYLVPFQLDPTVIITANGSNNEIRRVSRNVVATGNTWNGISAGLVSWSWDAEASEVSDDAPTFAQPAIPIYMARGFVPISIEALEDEANVTGNVAELLAGGREVLEAAAFTTGSGVGQPTGVITALTGGSSEVASATADTLAVGDVYGLWGSLPTRYRRNATWVGNTLIYNRIRQFDTAGGSALWANIGGGTPDTLLGRPAIEAEDLSGTITAAQNNRVLVVGDFQNYVIADRIGMTVEFIPHLFGTTNGRPKGQRGWFAYYRTGATVVNPAAFRLLNV